MRSWRFVIGVLGVALPIKVVHCRVKYNRHSTSFYVSRVVLPLKSL